MTTRRNFIRGLGLFSAFAAGAGTANTAIAAPKCDPKLAPPDNATTLQISGTYNDSYVTPQERMRFTSDGRMMLRPELSFTATKRNTHNVSMTVGRDNRLWIKVDNKWKRVAIEE